MEIFTRKHRWYTVLPLTAILAVLLTLTGYWQLIFAAGFLAGVLMKRPRAAFVTAFLGGALAWGIPLLVATTYVPVEAAAALLLSILDLPSSLTFLPFVLSALIGGITTGLGALLGAYGYAVVVRPAPVRAEG